MKHSLILLIIVLLFTGCSSSDKSTPSYTKTTVNYSIKGVLHGSEVEVGIRNKSLYLKAIHPMSGINKSRQYTLTNSEIKSVYDFLKENNFNEIKSPAKSMLTDVPIVILTVSYDKYKNTIDLTAAEEIPPAVVNLSELLMTLAQKYDSTWQGE